jgi:hypothetical protein
VDAGTSRSVAQSTRTSLPPADCARLLPCITPD